MTKPGSEIVAAAQAAEKKWRIPASVQIAQWALESAWGAHQPGFNGFGIKAMPGYATQTFATHEFQHGHMIACNQTFAKFDSLAQAFDCHAKLLATSAYYKLAMAALPDVPSFVSKLAVHYATDPLYSHKVMAVINSANLTKYDHVSA